MKNFIVTISLAALIAGGMATNASAQRYDPRIDTARLFDESRTRAPGNEIWRDENRLAAELDQLGGDASRLRKDLRGADRPLRRRFDGAKEKLDRLNTRFRRGGNRRDVWRDAEKLRAEFSAIRAELKSTRR